MKWGSSPSVRTHPSGRRCPDYIQTDRWNAAVTVGLSDQVGCGDLAIANVTEPIQLESEQVIRCRGLSLQGLLSALIVVVGSNGAWQPLSRSRQTRAASWNAYLSSAWGFSLNITMIYRIASQVLWSVNLFWRSVQQRSCLLHWFVDSLSD